MKIRIKFSKKGVIKYIGHLDLLRYFQKALRRTDIDVIYSKGFSPHMIMSFAQPLGVGVESEGEYFDLEISDSVDVSCVLDKLNATMAEGVEILKVTVLPEKAVNAMASVKAADYVVTFKETLPAKLYDTYKQSDRLDYTKVTKTGEHILDLKTFTYDFKVLSENSVFMRVDCSSSGNLKPGTLLECLFEKCGYSIKDYSFHILRKDLYCEDGKGQLISLGDV